MNDEKGDIAQNLSAKDAELEDHHYRLIIHISKQNQARAAFLNNIETGEPVWDFLLDLVASEYLDRSTSVPEISKRLGISQPLCQRCAGYLMSRDAIFENRNQYTSMTLPWLASESTKKAIKGWLDSCISEIPSF